MNLLRRLFIAAALLPILSGTSMAQGEGAPLYIDFRNQKIADIIYSMADACGGKVLVDETVTGNATFRFEDDSFESALKKFAAHCHLHVNKDGDAYVVSKVLVEMNDGGMFSVNTENVQIEPFLNFLSRRANRTIVFDSLPAATVTIRAVNSSLEDILNLAIVKFPGYGLERIGDGFYITKSAGNLSRRNLDVFTLSEVSDSFSCSIQKAAFSNVLDTLFRKGGREYSLLARNSVQLEGLSYSEKGFDELLSLLLCQANCDFTVMDGVYYIYEIQKKDVLKKFKDTRIVKLANIGVENLLSLLPADLNASGFMKIDRGANSVILTGSASEIEPIVGFIEKVDVPSAGMNFRSFYLENINAKDAVAAIPKSMLISDVTMLPSANGFVTQVSDDGGESLAEFVRILDSRKQNHVVKLKYIKSEELLKTLPPSVGKDSVSGTSDPSVVFFSGTDGQYAAFKKDLESIDCPKRQIKYHLLVVQRQKTDGFNWSPSFSANDSSDDSGYTWSGMLSSIFNINFDVISKFGMQFAGSLNAELSEGKSRVLADTTLNGISGESLSFSNTNTYRYRDIIVDTSGDLYTSTTREITSGLTLSISGWASGDEIVTVKIDAQVSKQGSSDSSSSSSTTVETTVPPSTSEKKVSTNVRGRSGEPIVIGGLFQQEEDITEKRFPVLGAIPLIGNLFKSRSVTMAESEFVIYLIPCVQECAEAALDEESNLERLRMKYRSKEG